MFPYSSSPYPSSLFPSSSSSSSSNSSSILFPHFPFLNLDQNASSSNNNNTFFHDPLSTFPYIPLTHHHHHPIIPETLTTNLAVTTENNNNNCVVTTTMPKLHHHDPPPLPPSSGGYGISCLLTKKPAKKDRHSKIYTSQGLRDRRVRLSIEIARKFFDLQDMLGFDKASNTLEWLFSKSKKAIKDLSKSKNNNSNNTTSSSECEDCEVVSHQQGVFSTIDDTTSPNLQQQQQQDAAKERNNSKLKRGQQKEPACVRANKMKESREKARARARERTSNKICNNNNNNNNQQLELKKKFPASASNENNPQFLHNSRSQLVVGGTSEAQRDNNEFNVIEESIVIKRKLKPSLNMASHHNHHHHHQNHVIFPKEASFINNNSAATHDYNHSFPTNLSSPNWDANNNNNGGGGGAPTGRSNFCAIASMNLSTGLQIFGKSWEECTNPRLH